MKTWHGLIVSEVLVKHQDQQVDIVPLIFNLQNQVATLQAENKTLKMMIELLPRNEENEVML